MTTSVQNVLPGRAAQRSTTRRHHRRTGAVAVADADSFTDNSTNQIALGSTWS